MVPKGKKIDYIYVGLLSIIAIVIAIRALYSFPWSDEAFYLTFTDRLIKGEKLIIDEWHPAQFYSVIVFPFIAVYQTFFGKTGIYLFARLLTIAITYLVSVFFYFALCVIARQGTAFLSACIFLTYSRANIFGPSYYNLFLICLILALSLVLFNIKLEGMRKKVSAIFAGFFTALAVLCMPYFAPFAVLLLGCFLVAKEYRSQATLATLGVVGAAFLFVLLFFPKDIPAVFQNLKFILSDPEHDMGPVSNLIDAATDVIQIFWRIGFIASLGVIGMIVCRFFFRNRWWEYAIGLLMAAVMVYSFFRFYTQIPGYAYYCFSFMAMPFLLECWMDRKINMTAFFIRVLGVFSALAFALGSNTFADAPIVGVLIYSIGGLLQLCMMFEDDARGIPLKRSLVCCAAILAISCTMGSRIVNVFRDAALSELNTTIHSGPLAGIRTTAEHAEQYNALLSVMNELNSDYAKENRLFVTKLGPWCYTATDFHYGTPTAWRTPLSSSRLESYYSIHPNAVPDIVVVLADVVGNYDNVLPNENEFSGYFWDHIIRCNYTQVKTDYADIYISPMAERKE